MNKTSIINLIENAKLVLGTSTLFSFILATNHRGLIISILFTLWIASIIISKKVK